MELQQLQHFLALARIGNIGRAAEELHITHSGLSRSIKTLEEFLGLPLFERLSRGVAITAFGEALLPRATHILNERARAISELEALRSLRAGRVEVALHPVFDDNVAIRALDDFTTRFPQVEIDIWSGADPELSNRLIAGDFDFAFTLFVANRDEQMLVYQPLFDLSVAVYGRAGHPSTGTHMDIGSLLAAEWALLGAGAFRRAFDQYFRGLGLAPPQRIRQCSSVALLRALVAGRDCVTMLPRFMAQDTGLTRIDTAIEASSIAGGILYRRGAALSLPATSLLEAFRRGGGSLA